MKQVISEELRGPLTAVLLLFGGSPSNVTPNKIVLKNTSLATICCGECNKAALKYLPLFAESESISECLT